MKYKTLVINKGTKYQEFYGYDSDYGWITCSAPIHMMNLDVTIEDIKRTFRDIDLDKVDLVTIEINFVED